MRCVRSFASVAVVVLTTVSPPSQALAQTDFSRGDRMPYDAFDSLAKNDVEVPGGVARVAFAPGEIALPKEKVLEWVKKSAVAVSTYYGRFPVKSVKLLIVPVNGAGIKGGTTWSYRGAAIRLLLGRDSSEDNLRRDWILVHEMVHLALPDVGERYGWLSEGLAVYIEPVARVQAGDLTANEVWYAMARDMPKGLPQAGDRGLDGTGSWGRKYWGGALFCLLADVEIRERSQNKFGLQDAMRGVIAAGGNHEKDWSIERVLDTADKAVGLDVLRTLYRRMGSEAVSPDIKQLWSELGVKVTGADVEFDDAAPRAATRKSITGKI